MPVYSLLHFPAEDPCVPKPLEALQLSTHSSEPPLNWGGLGPFWAANCIIKPLNIFLNWMFQLYEYMKKNNKKNKPLLFAPLLSELKFN